MIEAPVVPGRDFDEFLEKGIIAIRNHILRADDDFILDLMGEPGTGKSTLSLHILGVYLPPEKLDIELAAFSKSDLAKSFKYASNTSKPRALWYDEANIQRREALTKWNRALLDLYYSVRGKNIFHIWCNPSLEMLDKPFLKERVKAVILVRGKASGLRYYYYFRRSDILKVLAKYETLDINLLSRVRGEYAYYKGWFRDYNGPLKQAYLEKKESRMTDKVQDFYDNFSDDETVSKKALARKLGISVQSITNYMNQGVIQEDLHYKITPTGLFKIKPEGVWILEAYLESKHKKKSKVIA